MGVGVAGREGGLGVAVTAGVGELADSALGCIVGEGTDVPCGVGEPAGGVNIETVDVAVGVAGAGVGSTDRP